MNNKDKKPFQSKKFIAMAIAVSFTTIFTAASLVMIAIVPQAASSIVNLMPVALASVNGAISLYAVGQSAVDWKINSQHQTSQENKILDIKQDLIQHQMKYKGEKDLNLDKV